MQAVTWVDISSIAFHMDYIDVDFCSYPWITLTTVAKTHAEKQALQYTKTQFEGNSCGYI